MSENSEQNMPTLIISDVGSQNINTIPQQSILNQPAINGSLDNQVANVPLTQQPIIQQPAISGSLDNQVTNVPLTQQTVIQQPVVQQPVVQQSVIQQPVIQQSVVQSETAKISVVPVNQQLPQPIPTTNHQNINIVVPNINNPEQTLINQLMIKQIH